MNLALSAKHCAFFWWLHKVTLATVLVQQCTTVCGFFWLHKVTLATVLVQQQCTTVCAVASYFIDIAFACL